MEISQRAMLAEMDIVLDENYESVFFEIEYITQSGEYRKYSKLGKNYKKDKIEGNKVKTNNYRVKEKGVLRVFDFVEQTYRTLLIDSIISFNKMRVV